MKKLSLLSIITIITMIALITPAMACEFGGFHGHHLDVDPIDLGPVYGEMKNVAALAMLHPALDPTTNKVQIALDVSNFENRNAVGLSLGLPLIDEKLFLHGTVSHVLETDVVGTSVGLTYSF